MYLSSYAQSLLNSGNIDALQALTYEQLFPEAVVQEIQRLFAQPKEEVVLTGDSVPEDLNDPLALTSLTNACVISSGHIFSKESIEDYLGGRSEALCPLSQQPLNLSLGPEGKPYIALPQVDALLTAFRNLPLHPEQKDDEVPSPALVGRFSVKVSNHIVRMVMTLDAAYCEAFSGFLTRRLPHSQVTGGGGSYSMPREAFGRCWKMRQGNQYEIDLWFPSKKNKSSSKRTFGNYHLNRLLTALNRIIPPEGVEEMKGEALLSRIEEIPEKEYRIAFEETPVNEGQMSECCYAFLQLTQDIAEELGWPIRDEVTLHTEEVSPSVTTGSGMFVAGNAQHTTSTVFTLRK